MSLPLQSAPPHPSAVLRGPGRRADADRAAAVLLAMMRAGEQSAALAFARIASRLSPGAYAHMATPLAALTRDEERHDVLLAACAAELPSVPSDHEARHFFRRLETREPAVHLARIAALDGCSCMLITQLLSTDARSLLPARLVTALRSIRHDEGRHVRLARHLACGLDIDTARIQDIGRGVRRSFAALMTSRADQLAALRVDATQLLRRVDP